MMRLHAIFCVVQLVIVISGSVYSIWFSYFTNLLQVGTFNKIYASGCILDALSQGLLYGYIGYLMTTLSYPEDPGKSQNVVKMLQGRSSFTIEDDRYQAEGLETIKAIIGQFLTNQIDREILW